MKFVAGVDIGNASTEVALANIEGDQITFLASGISDTTGIKGTLQNINGVFSSLKGALNKLGKDFSDLDEIRINEAAPVIGDVAMETISQTVITESTVIGHNPNTPGGTGIGVGVSTLVTDLAKLKEAMDAIVIVPGHISFEDAADMINKAGSHIHIAGAILQSDDGNLLHNACHRPCPDEVHSDDAHKEGNDRKTDNLDRTRQVDKDQGCRKQDPDVIHITGIPQRLYGQRIGLHAG